MIFIINFNMKIFFTAFISFQEEANEKIQEIFILK